MPIDRARPPESLLPIPILLIASILTACGERSRPEPSVSVRDSAGIRIVENQDYQWPGGQGWRLSQQPLLDIGVLEGDANQQLYRVSGALLLKDGRIVVANSGTSELRFYDASGTFLSSSGREGGGPGEFEGLVYLRTLAGDSLLTYDFRQRRISIFDPEGVFVRSFTPGPLAGSVGFPDYLAPLSEGTILLSLQNPLGGEIKPGLVREPLTYVLCDSEGALIDTLGRFPGAEWYVRTQGESARRMVTVSSRVFGRQPNAAVYGNGFYYGAGDSYEIAYYGTDARLERLIRRAQANLEVSAEDIERYQQERLDRARDEDERIRTERALAGMSFPKTMPAYDDLLVDSEGNLWVAEYRRPGEEQPRWTLFDSEGLMLGVVKTPPRFTVYQIGSDFLLGRWQDELDVEHIQLYELVKN